MRVMGVKFNPLEQISLKVILRKGVDVWMDKEMDSRYIVYLQDMGFFGGGASGLLLIEKFSCTSRLKANAKPCMGALISVLQSQIPHLKELTFLKYEVEKRKVK